MHTGKGGGGITVAPWPARHVACDMIKSVVALYGLIWCYNLLQIISHIKAGTLTAPSQGLCWPHIKTLADMGTTQRPEGPVKYWLDRELGSLCSCYQIPLLLSKLPCKWQTQPDSYSCCMQQQLAHASQSFMLANFWLVQL